MEINTEAYGEEGCLSEGRREQGGGNSPAGFDEGKELGFSTYR